MRSVDKHTFGILKSWFRCLHHSGGAMLCGPGKAWQIAVVWCTWRNFTLRKRSAWFSVLCCVNCVQHSLFGCICIINCIIPEVNRWQINKDISEWNTYTYSYFPNLSFWKYTIIQWGLWELCWDLKKMYFSILPKFSLNVLLCVASLAFTLSSLSLFIIQSNLFNSKTL